MHHEGTRKSKHGLHANLYIETFPSKNSVTGDMAFIYPPWGASENRNTYARLVDGRCSLDVSANKNASWNPDQEISAVWGKQGIRWYLPNFHVQESAGLAVDLFS